MTRSLFAFALAVAAACALARDFGFGSAAGPYAVGLRVRQQYDAGRTAPALVRSLLWYPAAAGGTALVYRDYVATLASAERVDLDPAAVRRTLDALIAQKSDGPRGAQVRRAMARPMLARREAPAVSGKFPVVIYAPGADAYAIDGADLCEFLASRGYLVLAGAPPGTRGAAAVAFLVGQARALPQADMAHVAVIGAP